MADIQDSGSNGTGVKVIMYATGWCPYCRRAESLLRDKGVVFDWIDVEDHPGRREDAFVRTPYRAADLDRRAACGWL